MPDLQYPKDAANRLNRLSNRGSHSLRDIHQLVNSVRLVHVSFTDPSSPFPAALPMIAHMGSFARPSADIGDPLDLYLHGHASSRIMRLASSSASSSSSPPSSPSRSGSPSDSSSSPGLPVCVSAARVDGLVLALSAFHHSYNYRSAVLFGHATPVTDPAEKLFALQLITDGVLPDRWAHTRLPPTPAELHGTAVLKVRIASASAKARRGGPSDDRHDLRDDSVRGALWAGVLPVWEVVGDPVGADYAPAVPAHVRDHVSESNAQNEEYAQSAARA